MKAQMRFQKIFMLVSLIIAALGIVYALIFCSGTFFQMQELYDPIGKVEYLTGAKALFDATQTVSDVMLVLAIVAVLAVVLNYIMATHRRRKYYVTNYIAIGIVVAVLIAVAIALIVLISNCLSVLNTINMAEAEEEYLVTKSDWHYTIWTVPVGFAYAAILVVDAVVFILNLVWKLKLMKGEKALLEQGLVKEVA